MKSKKIRRVFERIYEYPNPIFCFPVLYVQHKQFLCEVAAAHSNLIGWPKWRGEGFTNSNPLYILEGLFVDNGLWCTVLERKNDQIIERHDLSQHINSMNNLNAFIYSTLD